MKKEYKELLLKDLCSRIMYGVKCTVYEDTSVHTLSGVLSDNVCNELYFKELDWKVCDGFANVQYCKPHLFPLSSMTEEQLLELSSILFENSIDSSIKTLNWCFKNHFDIYGLIPKGLAIDATGLNIY